MLNVVSLIFKPLPLSINISPDASPPSTSPSPVLLFDSLPPDIASIEVVLSMLASLVLPTLAEFTKVPLALFSDSDPVSSLTAIRELVSMPERSTSRAFTLASLVMVAIPDALPPSTDPDPVLPLAVLSPVFNVVVESLVNPAVFSLVRSKVFTATVFALLVEENPVIKFWENPIKKSFKVFPSTIKAFPLAVLCCVVVEVALPLFASPSPVLSSAELLPVLASTSTPLSIDASLVLLIVAVLTYVADASFSDSDPVVLFSASNCPVHQP